ncbi:MAG: competence protein ComEC, partial [Alphaproteobacteria bacterium]|nr:competence protein ComEC [Alphaproteobacteria bacterium]
MLGQGTGRGRTTLWPLGGQRADAWRWPASRTRLTQSIPTIFKEWALADVAPGRLVPWLPVAFGSGIALYFAAEREPSAWAAAALALTCVVCAILLRRRPVAFPLALAFTAIAAGFAVATLRSARIAHPVLAAPATLTISGWVEVREERERSDRIVVRAHRVEGGRLTQTPERVRVALRKGTAPPVGAFVEMRARLAPPLAPLRPGGYDFARDLYFQQIGASGYVLGQIKTVEPPTAQTLRLRYAAAVDALRDGIDKRIRAVVPGDEGAIASALITGKRDAISKELSDAMYISSLAHVLSISGYHMALVAGVVFFVFRAGFALLPTFASRYPIKKFAALAAFAVASFYLVLSGAEVATQRSFIMLSIVLLAVLLDRTALTLRTLATAALAVLLITPEAVVHPSFQMSFAATLALVAVYGSRLGWGRPNADDKLHARVALWGGREIVALILASLVAGLATTPYAAYHFHRAAPYGVLANLLAMPIVSLWVMPMGLVAVLMLPFGFDSFSWRLMGEGIRWMDAVALWVAGLPGAVGRISAFGIGPLLLGTVGLLLVCLLRTPLRWSGGIAVVLACVWALATPSPDIFVASDGRVVAARGSDGRLAVIKTGSDSFAVREWLAADGDARAPGDPSLPEGTKCDAAGCVARLADGRFVALALSPEAFEDDCRRAAVVVTAGHGPSSCQSIVSDRQSRLRTGAVSLRRAGDGFAITPTRMPGYDRPWAPAAPPIAEAEP